MKRLFVIAILCTTLGGCAAWTRVEQPEASGPNNSYSVNLPTGWVRADLQDRLLVTRDGVGIQTISIIKLDNEKAFPKLKKAAEEDALPSELAELQLAEIKASDEQFANLRVLENSLTTVAGLPAYKLYIQFKNTRGLPIELLMHGLIYKKSYYVLVYQAPALHYFPKNKGEFEAVVSSFRLI